MCLAYSEFETIEKAKAGDHSSIQLLIEKNRGTITYQMKRYLNHIEEEDLLQCGYEGIIIAIKRFKPEKGYRFYTYASWWVRYTMTRFICEQASLPQNFTARKKLIQKGFKTTSYLEDLFINHEDVISSNDPTPEDISIFRNKKEKITCCISKLNNNEKIVTHHYLLKDVPLETIAKTYGLTRQRWDQISKSALYKLKNCLRRSNIYG
jgi:RNA polymerase sigma factor (sigma-70 family)